MINERNNQVTKNSITVVHEEERGRILTADSMTFFDERVSTRDIIVCGSYGAASSLRWVHFTGAKGAITHECGIGKDNAGIGGLAAAQEHGIPMVACETMSARLADGASVYETGKVGHANQAAKDLGVSPGQPIAEAAHLMLKAPAGKIIETRRLEEVQTITLLDETQDGTIFASWGLPVLKNVQDPHPTSVFVQGSHCGQTLPSQIIRLQLQGIITNDAGRGMDDSGISAFGPLNDAGISAAAVGAMSARIGDTMSTWNDGIISCMNAVAESRGVRPGITAREAAKKMLTS
jgi:hypothetical protein